MASSERLLLLIVQLTLLAVCASMLLAWLRNPVVNLLAELFNVAGLLLRLIAQRLQIGANWCRARVEATLLGLQYGPEPAATDPSALWNGWDVLVPLVWLTALVMATLGDGAVMYLRLAAMFGFSSNAALPNVPLLLSVVWVSGIVVYGLMLFELIGASPLRQPFGKLDGRRQTAMLVLAITGVSFATAGAAISLVWGQLRLMGHDEPALALAFLIILGVLVTVGLAIAGWSAPVATAVVWLVSITLAWACTVIARIAVETLFRLLDSLVTLLVAAYELAAWIGRRVWDWATSFAPAESLHLEPLEWEERPPIGVAFSSVEPGEPDQRDRGHTQPPPVEAGNRRDRAAPDADQPDSEAEPAAPTPIRPVERRWTSHG